MGGPVAALMVHERAEIGQIAAKQHFGSAGVSSAIDRLIFLSKGSRAGNGDVIPTITAPPGAMPRCRLMPAGKGDLVAP
jgi:hypothetical protein